MSTHKLYFRDVETGECDEIEMSADSYLKDWNYELKTDYRTITDFNQGELYYELFYKKVN